MRGKGIWVWTGRVACQHWCDGLGRSPWGERGWQEGTAQTSHVALRELLRASSVGPSL